MKKQVRQNVFETNSSSVHSIAIAKGEQFTIPEEIHFGFNDYGWGPGTISTIDGRASYLWTAIGMHYSSGEMGVIQRKIVTHFATKFNINCIFTDLTQAKDYYIDHGDETGDFVRDVVETLELMEMYLLNPDSYVEIGNDNDDSVPAWPNEQYFIGYRKGN